MCAWAADSPKLLQPLSRMIVQGVDTTALVDVESWLLGLRKWLELDDSLQVSSCKCKEAKDREPCFFRSLYAFLVLGVANRCVDFRLGSKGWGWWCDVWCDVWCGSCPVMMMFDWYVIEIGFWLYHVVRQEVLGVS